MDYKKIGFGLGAFAVGAAAWTAGTALIGPKVGARRAASNDDDPIEVTLSIRMMGWAATRQAVMRFSTSSSPLGNAMTSADLPRVTVDTMSASRPFPVPLAGASMR